MHVSDTAQSSRHQIPKQPAKASLSTAHRGPVPVEKHHTQHHQSADHYSNSHYNNRHTTSDRHTLSDRHAPSDRHASIDRHAPIDRHASSDRYAQSNQHIHQHSLSNGLPESSVPRQTSTPGMRGIMCHFSEHQ